MRLAVVHRAVGTGEPPAGSLTWKTCLREVHFLDDRSSAPTDAIVDADAYRLLLEIVCGLRSPLVGETEVQAQFKTFLSTSAGTGHAALTRLGQRILADAKHIRRRWLQGFGAHSYGHLVRPYLRSPLVAIVGTGAMARQVVTETPSDRSIDVWGRRWPDDDTWRDARITFRLLDRTRAGRPASTETCTLVIAAPIDVTSLATVEDSYPALARVVDLRADDHRTPPAAGIPHVTLSHLFTDAGQGQRDATRRIREAHDEIARRSSSFMARTEMRPFGWDDVLA